MTRPDLGHGASSEWTWLAHPLAANERVKAVDYIDEWDNVYRQDFHVRRDLEARSGSGRH